MIYSKVRKGLDLVIMYRSTKPHTHKAIDLLLQFFRNKPVTTVSLFFHRATKRNQSQMAQCQSPCLSSEKPCIAPSISPYLDAVLRDRELRRGVVALGDAAAFFVAVLPRLLDLDLGAAFAFVAEDVVAAGFLALVVDVDLVVVLFLAFVAEVEAVFVGAFFSAVAFLPDADAERDREVDLELDADFDLAAGFDSFLAPEDDFEAGFLLEGLRAFLSSAESSSAIALFGVLGDLQHLRTHMSSLKCCLI